MSSKGDPICAAIIGLFIGLGLLYSGLQRYLLLQKINNTPTSTVRAAAVGLVELFGKAVCKEPALSPISQEKCVYYKIRAEYYVSGKHGGWRDLYTDVDRSEFYLEDETGRMLINPEGAQVEIPEDYSSKGWLNPANFLGFGGQPLGQPVMDYLERDPSAKARAQSRSGHELRFTEYFIAEGDPLYVLGTAEPMAGSQSAVGNENLVIKKGKYEGTYFVSDSSERKITDSIRGSMYWQVGGGLILSAVCAYYIAYRLFGGM